MENNAKNFALQLGSLISLFVVTASLTTLVLGIITIFFPDEANLPWEYESASSSVRMTIALLCVFFPTYVLLTRFVNSGRRSAQENYLKITKWLIYVALLIGGGVLLGDLVAVIQSFLSGELTTRFLLKALAILAIVGAAFTYYLLDARNYWMTHEKYSKLYGAGVGFIVIVAIVTGYTHIDSPKVVREIALDQKQINDLQNIQSSISSYLAINNTLPETLDAALGDLPVPEAPKDRAQYTYSKVDDTTFKLCATFAEKSRTYGLGASPVIYTEKTMVIKNPDDWNHTKGEWCFIRSVSSLK